MKIMQSHRLHLAPLALAAALTALASAQTSVESNIPGAGFDTPQASPQQASAPTLQVYSRETILDVLVADDKGNPVRGLTKSDFTVSEDNKPQPIRSFYEYSKDTPPAPAQPLPPSTYSNAHALPANGPVQIFYFDIPCAASYPVGSDPVADTAIGQIVIRAKKYIAEYPRTMPAGTQVAVFAHRCDYGLRLLQGFTTDGEKAAAAIDNLVVLSVGTGTSAANSDPVAAANQIAAYVAGIHGRKNLIWISSSPLPIMRDGGLSFTRSSPDMVFIHRLMDTYDTFTREQIAIYPFNPCGVASPICGKPLSFGSLAAEDIATETGGAAIYNNNDFKGAAAKIVDDTSHYYTLSYIPPRATEDGHYHAIKIDVDRPGLHLTYRGGYNSEQPVPPDDVLKVHMDQATMGLGSLPSTQLTFDLQVTPAAPNPDIPNSGNPAQPTRVSDTRRALSIAGKAPITCNTLFKLDQTQITFAKTPDATFAASLEFDLAAYDSYGKLLTVRSQTLKLTLTPEEHAEFIQTPFKFFLPIDLPPGPVTLRAGVFDANTSKAGTLEVPLTVPGK